MTYSARFIPKAAAIFLVALLISLLAACGGGGDGSNGNSGSPSSPAATPEPTPTPNQVLDEGAAALLELETVGFSITHEEGNIPLMTGVLANEITGVVNMPDELDIDIKGEVAVFSAYLELQVVRTEGTYFLTDPLTGAWRTTPDETVPFDLTSVAITIGDIMKDMTETAYTGDGYYANPIHVTGKVMSEQLGGLIPFAAEGYPVDLEVWLRQSDKLLERARIAGRVVESDAENYVRILTLRDYNKDVNIERPPV